MLNGKFLKRGQKICVLTTDVKTGDLVVNGLKISSYCQVLVMLLFYPLFSSAFKHEKIGLV